MLDVGCGRGRLVNALAAKYPASHFVGMDFSFDAFGTRAAKRPTVG